MRSCTATDCSHHLRDPLGVLRSAAARCRGLLLLETKVRMADQSGSLQEDPENPTNSVEGPVTLLTRDELLAALAALFPHVYTPSVPVAHEQFPSDWDRGHGTQWPIRAVFVASRLAARLADPAALPRLARPAARQGLAVAPRVERIAVVKPIAGAPQPALTRVGQITSSAPSTRRPGAGSIPATVTRR